MSQEYVFEFPGTKEDFMNSLNRFSHNASYSSGTFYYFDDYIVKLIGDEIHFGVARGDHVDSSIENCMKVAASSYKDNIVWNKMQK